MFRASDLARTVAQGVSEYGPVTVRREGTDWVLSARVEYTSAHDLFGPSVEEERAEEAEERRNASHRAWWAKQREREIAGIEAALFEEAMA